MKSVHICPMCQCERRRNIAPNPHLIPVDDRIRQLVEDIIQQYGSVRFAGRMYAERFGLRIKPDGQWSSGAQQLTRIRTGWTERIHPDTLDRLEVFAAS